MSKGVFDHIVLAQDKTLTGSWKPRTLFVLIFLISFGYLMIMKKIENEVFSFENSLKLAIKVALFALVVNYITGKLFTSREKMYKSLGFSNKSSKGQAYADARLGQFVAAVGGGIM